MTEKTSPEDKFIEKVLIVIGLVALSFLLLVLLYFAFDVLLLIFGAVLIAIFLRGLASVLGHVLKIGEGWRLAIVSAALLLLFIGAVYLLAPNVGDQVERLKTELPRSARSAAEYISQFGWGRALIDQLPSFDEVMKGISAGALLTGVGGIFSSTVGAVGNFLITILLAIYFAAHPNFYLVGFVKLFPKRFRQRTREVLSTVGEMLRWWLIGKAGSMLFIGTLTWIGLSVLGMPLALTLGLIAGLLSFIPNFGPILSAIPAILLAFIESPSMAMYTAGL